MAPRLLAYGGTGFTERRRIGSWDIPSGVLQDLYALPPGVTAFGVALRDRQPYLVIRQRQNVDNRGGYPYTVLLDPGESTWVRFGWNAALLAHSLLEGDPSLTARLLVDPEHLGEAELEDLIQRVPPTTLDREVCGDPGEVRELWVGAAMAPDVGSDPLLIAPTAYPSDDLLDMARLAVALDTLDPCFRIGAGWLIRGGIAHGLALGARLVVDPEGAANSPLVQNLQEHGRRLLTTLSRLATVAGFQTRFVDRKAEPVHRWDVAAERFFGDAALLASLEESAEPAEELFEQILTSRGHVPASVLLGELNRAGSNAVMRGTAKLGKVRTTYLLGEAFDNGLTVHGDTAARLDEAAMVECFAARNIPPHRWPAHIALSPRHRFLLWQSALRRARGRLPVLLKDALGDLELNRRDPEVEALVQAAIDRTSELRASLIDWLEVAADDRLDHLIGPRLKAAAWNRVHGEPSEWVGDYLAFADDPGGREVAERIGLETARGLVSDVVAARGGPLRHHAEQWLGHVATSPLRRRISTALKLEIADLAPHAWRSLVLLRGLCRGSIQSEVWSLPNAEKDALREELADIVAVAMRPAPVPNLEAIVRLLDVIPATTIDALAHLEPPLIDSAATNRWLAGWQLLDRLEVYQQEQRRYQRGLQRRYLDWAVALPSPRQADRPSLDDAGLIDLLAELLFEGPTQDDAARRAHLARILRVDGKRVLGLAPEAIRKSAWREVTAFLQRFTPDYHPLDALFGGVPDPTADEFMATCARSAPRPFRSHAVAALKPYVNRTRSPEPDPYVQALARFLRSDTGAGISEQIGTALLTEDRLEKFRRDLARITKGHRHGQRS